MRGDIIKIVVCGSVIVSVSLTSVTVCADETKVDIPLMQPTPAPGMPGPSPYSFTSLRLNNAVAAGQAAGALIPDIEDRIAKLTQASNELGTLLSNPVNTSPNSQTINKTAVDTKALISTEIENLTRLKTAAEEYKAVTTPIPPGSARTGRLSNDSDPGDFQWASERLKSIMTNAIQNADTLINSSTMITTNPSTSNINITKAADTTSTYFNGEINTSVNATTANTVGAISTGKTTAVITGLGSGTVNATDNGEGQVPSHVIAVGNNTFASVKDGESAIVIGDDAHVENSSIGIGRMAIATKDGLALGDGTNAGDSAMAIGTSAKATSLLSTAIGNSSEATRKASLAVGLVAHAEGEDSTAIGTSSSATGNDSIAIGSNSNATGQASVATGSNSTATGQASVATGSNSTATGANSVALGANSVADKDNDVSIGGKIINKFTGLWDDFTRTLSGVTDGTDIHDAVNKGQLDTAKTDAINEAKGYTDTEINKVLNNGSSTTAAAFSIGEGAQATGIGSAATGVRAKATRESSTATGVVSQATGGSSTATGGFSTATGENSTATGAFATATGARSTATGMHSKATGANSVALGAYSVADKDNDVSIGGIIFNNATGDWEGFTRTLSGLSDGTDAHDAVTKGQLDNAIAGVAGGVSREEAQAMADGAKTAANTHTDSEILKVLNQGSSTLPSAFSIGKDAQATATGSTATGANSKATGFGSLAMGLNAQATGDSSISTGRSATATGEKSTATGSLAWATGDFSTATGMRAQATGEKSTATGTYSMATGANSVALGAYSVAEKDNDVSIGGSMYNSDTGFFDDFTRTLSGLADGTDAHDAVNKGQLDTAKTDAIDAAKGYTDTAKTAAVT
ncbi:hypothetical protein AHN45_24905, partial [Salmonella enterica subsp. enterica]|nr:hypothetical protein [Salmonella enterica subsp. enterica]